ncbi:MAG: zinc-ribbon domain-containing protein [Deltaproteobacteria bacterium]
MTRSVSIALNLYAMIASRVGGIRAEPGERNAFCPQCGAATAGGDRFCRSCGAALR